MSCIRRHSDTVNNWISCVFLTSTTSGRVAMSGDFGIAVYGISYNLSENKVRV